MTIGNMLQTYVNTVRGFLLVWMFFAVLGFAGCHTRPYDATQTNAIPLPSRSPSPSDATKTGWWGKICDQTMATGVEIVWAGSKEKAQTWRKGEEHDAPRDVRQAESVSVRATADAKGDVVHMCIYYKQTPTQQMFFNDKKSQSARQMDQNVCECR